MTYKQIWMSGLIVLTILWGCQAERRPAPEPETEAEDMVATATPLPAEASEPAASADESDDQAANGQGDGHGNPNRKGNKSDEEQEFERLIETLRDEWPRAACTEAHPHPQGVKIYQEFGINYSEVMTWFCQDIGFGDIRLAYRASAETGVPVEEIFKRFLDGEIWADIFAAIGATTVSPEEEEDDGD